jgi:hypothetical protein
LELALLQVWVDPATWTAVALEVRPSWVAPTYATLFLPSLRGVGDVLLVHDASVLEPQGQWAPGGCDPLVGADVVTESGEFIGKARPHTHRHLRTPGNMHMCIGVTYQCVLWNRR